MLLASPTAPLLLVLMARATAHRSCAFSSSVRTHVKDNVQSSCLLEILKHTLDSLIIPHNSCLHPRFKTATSDGCKVTNQVQDQSRKSIHEVRKQGWALEWPVTARTEGPGLSQNRSPGPLGRGGGGPKGGWAGPGRPIGALTALTILSSFLRAMVLACQGCKLLRQGCPLTSRTFKHS